MIITGKSSCLDPRQYPSQSLNVQNELCVQEFFCFEQFTSAQSNIRFITNKWTESVLTQFFFSNKIFITSRLIEGSLKNCLQTMFVIYRVTAWHPYYLKNTFTDLYIQGKANPFFIESNKTRILRFFLLRRLQRSVLKLPSH